MTGIVQYLSFFWDKDSAGLRFVFQTSLPPLLTQQQQVFVSNWSLKKNAVADFFPADLPLGPPTSTAKVKCHDMIRELRRSLGPLWHKTYEPLRFERGG